MDADTARERASQLWDGLALGDYQYRDLNPSAYSWLQDYGAQTYNPTQAATSVFSAPTAATSLVGPVSAYSTRGYDGFVGDQARLDEANQAQMRDRQVQGLDRWDNLAKTGLNQDERIAINRIQDAAGVARQRADAAVLRDMGERGTLGSGSELATRLFANQAASKAAATNADAMADLTLQRQFQAAGAADQMAGNIRAGDVDLASRQAQLFDNFQVRREGIVNQARQYAVEKQNQASQWAADANAQGNIMNAQMQNQMAQFNANNDFNARKTNADSMNSNARFNAAAKNEAGQWNASTQNDQNKFNLTARQQLANDNTTMFNRNEQQNLDNYNTIQGLRNADKLRLAGGHSNALNAVATSADFSAAAAANNSTNQTKGWIDAGTGILKAAPTIASGVQKVGSWLDWW